MGARRLFGLLCGFAAAVLSVTTLSGPARCDQPLRFVLVRVEEPPPVAGYEASPGKVTHVYNTARYEYRWDVPPASFGPEGFSTRLNLSGSVQPDTSESKLFSVIVILSDTLVSDPEYGDLDIGELKPGETMTAPEKSVTIRPAGPILAGQVAEITLGPSDGPTTYYYQAGTGPGVTGAPGLTARIDDCPATIEISALPSVACHITIGGFRKDTADPVEVVLPSAIDLAGNHGNGLQLANTAGSLDVANITDPYSWTMTIFACPGQQGAGVNCAGSNTGPGPATVPIIVRQKGMQDAEATLAITAMHKPDGTGDGTGSADAVTSSSVASGPGQIGARIECPGTIFISALPSLNCQIVITGWRRDSADPVLVTLPSAVDAFGNHANGIQIQTEGEQDHLGWGEEYRWSMLVFACPGESNTGASCMGNATTPGVQTLPIIVSQGVPGNGGLEAAEVHFRIDAQPHP